MTGSAPRNIQASVHAPDERPGKRAWQAVGVSAVGYALDGFDLLILGFALTAITATFSLSGTQAGSLATITLLGAVLGGFVGGILSDYIGRVKVLTYSILIFAVFTALTGLSPNFALLTVFRFLAGVGLGAEFGVGMTLAAETWPAKMRARATSYVALGWQAGVLLAAIVAAWAIPTIGWRGLFMLGAIPAVFAFFVRRNVDEPALFEERRHEAKEKFPLMQLFRDAETSKSAVGMFVLCSVQNFGYFGLMVWLPSYLAKQYGFGLTKSAVWTGVTVLGMAAGIFIFGQLADRFGRRPMLFVFQAGAAISVLAYSRINNEVTLLIGGAIMGVFVNGMLGGYGALMAELFPTTARATAQNVLFNLGRGVGGFAPLVIAAVATAYSFQLAIGLLSIIYVIDIIATIFLIPERKGVELE
jgi:MFS family permease